MTRATLAFMILATLVTGYTLVTKVTLRLGDPAEDNSVLTEFGY